MQHPAYCQRIDPKRSKKLFAEICSTLKRGKLYRNPKLTAQELATLLKTNTRYIAAVVQLNTNDNFSSLLNTFRLADAEQMLIASSEYSAEEIALMSGFGSRQSFYKVFVKKHGIAPSQFRIQHREQSL